MANGLCFLGQGGAKGEGIMLMNSAPAVEFSMLTTNKDSCILVSLASCDWLNTIQVDCMIGILRLDDQGQIWFDLYSETIFPTNKLLTQIKFAPVQLNDGNLHHLSLYFCGGWDHECRDVRLYVDGNPINIAERTSKAESNLHIILAQIGTVPKESSTINLSNSRIGSIMFGADAFFQPAYDRSFIGKMSEIRIWGGGNPDWIFEPAFSLNVAVPIKKDANYLQFYWPMWATCSTPLTDVKAGCTLSLGQGVSQVSDLPQIYDDMSDVLTNVQRIEFDLFKESAPAQAFSYIMENLKLKYTSKNFRELYLKAENVNTMTAYLSEIKTINFEQVDKKIVSEYQRVQQVLILELSGAIQLWGYYQTAVQGLTLVSQKFEAAARAVMEVAIKADISIQSQSQNTDSLDAGAVINAIGSAASLAGAYGKVVGFALKVLWTAISWMKQTSSPPSKIEDTIDITSKGDGLENAVSVLTTTMWNDLKSSIDIVASNAGLLQDIGNRISNGGKFTLQNEITSDSLENVYNLMVIFMTRVLFRSTFTYWIMKKDFPLNLINNESKSPFLVPVVQDPLFGIIFGENENPLNEPEFTGTFNNGGAAIVGYFVQNGYNGYPTYYSLPNDYASLLNEASQEVANKVMSQSEVFSWFKPIHLTYN